MWTYEQSTGSMIDATGAVVGEGYSGGGEGKNNPLMQAVPNVGPLPQGQYSIEAPVDSKTHGPYAMHLVPDTDNEMFGRDAFLIHGDSVVAPGTASEGCIIQNHEVRVKIWESNDHRLQVVDKVNA